MSRKKAKKATPEKEADLDLLSGLFRRGVSAMIDAGLKEPKDAAKAFARSGVKSPGDLLLKTARRLALEDDRIQQYVQLAAASSPILAAKAEEFGLLMKDATPDVDPDVKEAEIV